jgi:hypothetical protein
MGLLEIIYPHTWYNVDNEDEKYWLAAIGAGRYNILKVDLLSGYYKEGCAVATMWNREYSRPALNVKVEFTYNEGDRSICSVDSVDWSTGLWNFRGIAMLHGFRSELFHLPPILNLSRRWLKGHLTRIADCISCTSTATLQHTRSSATLKLPCFGSAAFPAVTAIRLERRSYIRITCRSDVANSTRLKLL